MIWDLESLSPRFSFTICSDWQGTCFVFLCEKWMTIQERVHIPTGTAATISNECQNGKLGSHSDDN